MIANTQGAAQDAAASKSWKGAHTASARLFLRMPRRLLRYTACWGKDSRKIVNSSIATAVAITMNRVFPGWGSVSA